MTRRVGDCGPAVELLCQLAERAAERWAVTHLTKVALPNGSIAIRPMRYPDEKAFAREEIRLYEGFAACWREDR